MPPSRPPKADTFDPGTAAETWNEPWVWRPRDFPAQALQLNVVEHQAPSVLVGLGNPGAALFTYNGFTPGPTIRMRGDETLRLKLLNHLGLNGAQSPVGAAPDLAAFVPRRADYPDGVALLEDWCLGEHTNGVHSARTTNLHTHGLHVRPGANPDGTHSDNIFLRVMPRADYQKRLAHDGCRFLRDLEQVGQPRWQDVFWLPRNGGRVVFRSRFPDFVGLLVNHCHILLHEDNGMMQTLEIVPDPQDANYVPRRSTAEPDATDEQVSTLYGRDTLGEACRQCPRFIDPNRNPHRYQAFPAPNGVFNPPSES